MHDVSTGHPVTVAYQIGEHTWDSEHQMRKS